MGNTSAQGLISSPKRKKSIAPVKIWNHLLTLCPMVTIFRHLLPDVFRSHEVCQ